MAGKTIKEQLADLCARMADEQNPKIFGRLVKEMSHLLAVEEMDRLLEAGEARLRDNPHAA
jgi:hypothetical protein